MFSMKLKHLFILILIGCFSVSCGSKKKVASEGKQRSERTENGSRERENPVAAPAGSYANVVQNYISEYADIAQEEMRLYKIPASITLAQGILESGAGRGDLTRRANNHFGIKCHDWTGEMVYHDDDRSQECFRKYNDPKYSYRDHSLFLTERKRYAALFDLDEDDYKGWAKGLREAGYATDRQYPRKLIDIIERYALYNYDAEVLGKEILNSPVIAEQNGNARGGTRHFVQKGDTLYSIAKRYNTTVENLQRYNNLQGTVISVGQEITVGLD